MRRNIAKASALASEKDVILARLDDLPAWVNRLISYIFKKCIFEFYSTIN